MLTKYIVLYIAWHAGKILLGAKGFYFIYLYIFGINRNERYQEGS